jgi:hypothetical protein
MNRPKLTKVLRIAWSVVWGVVAVLLVVLWARSYKVAEAIFWHRQSNTAIFTSALGAIQYDQSKGVSRGAKGWQFVDDDLSRVKQWPVFRQFEWQRNINNDLQVVLPWWFAITLTGMIAVIPWLPLKRFGLRTLLIATTLVAVGLGAIIALSR